MDKAKYLYETTVLRETEVPKVETRIENGQEVKITRTVKEMVPVKIALAKPDRKRIKGADIFYAQRLSAYLRDGLLPHSLVTKRYLNDGGPLSEEEKKFVDKLREQYLALQDEYFGMKSPLTNEQVKRRAEIILELNEINRTLQSVQENYAEVFNNTAEAKAKGDVVEWWILNLSLIDMDGKGYQPMFGEGTFDERMTFLEKLENKDDPFTNEAIRKVSYFISFWNTAGPTLTDDDFKSAEKNYDAAVSSLAPKEESKEEQPQTPPAATPVTPETAAPVATPEPSPAPAVAVATTT